MQPFDDARVAEIEAAIAAAAVPDTWLIAGGTELVNLMKEGIHCPARLIDLNRLPLGRIDAGPTGLAIGALSRMSDVAEHAAVKRDYPAITEALRQSPSPQLPNMASMGGNLMQRTRCSYFRADTNLPCNERRPRSGCTALEGGDRNLAIFGWTEHCLATYPSDVAVALAALDAVVHVRGAQGARRIPLTTFHRLPEDSPARDTVLERGELITAIEVPASPAARRSHYLKLRERASYKFTLVSAAVAIDLDGGHIREARVALGGVAHKPWRLTLAEQSLRGTPLEPMARRAAIDGAFAEARPRRHNGFKIELAKRASVRALMTAATRSGE